MLELEAVIFDCDGVMFDSRQANIRFYNHLLRHFGLPAMDPYQESLVHMHTAQDSVRLIFEGTGFMDEAQAYRMRVDYRPFIQDMILEKGLRALLDALKGCVRLAVATNRSNTIGDVLQWHGLEGYFDMVVSSMDVTHPKPHPESLQKILQSFDMLPQHAVYVGDSTIDLQTAEAAGVPFIAYGTGNLNALRRVENMEQLHRTLASLNSAISFSLVPEI